MSYNYDLSQKPTFQMLMGNCQSLNALDPCIKVLGYRSDYKKKRNWAIMIAHNGQLMTGYYGWLKYRPAATDRSAHYVFKTVVTVADVYRGQSGFQIGLKTASGFEIETGATGTLEIMKRLADQTLVGNASGEFELTFTVEKKGENAYIEPYFGDIIPLESV
ncbi:hypothetical protein phiAS5_ORF0104 [Aeromonas phage phiAS5]|uniref:Uncharacterized protein n=1 Tax=Aeromonas phage phiAS5 TaxID=879630 RepID=E1A2K1_9CAUD|nr:hypothetical protein phiAS5_ORF0104 [Aeromonas phage phiAS5]ADM79947.1 hypothetical protein phiAS5_ORF0104 [Aeromonas phage phiAS5]